MQGAVARDDLDKEQLADSFGLLWASSPRQLVAISVERGGVEQPSLATLL